VSTVGYCLQLLIVGLQFPCDEFLGCVLMVVEWRCRVKCVCYFFTRAHILIKKKKICTCYLSCCRNEEGCYIHIHSTPVFYMETQSERKPDNYFSYMYLRITFIRSTNFLFFPAVTQRRLQPPSFSGYNLREPPTPQFSGYNLKEVETPYVLRLQPEGGYNHLSFPNPTTLTYKFEM
jgi:hypothetical protein